jgi:GxxExxY protein
MRLPVRSTDQRHGHPGAESVDQLASVHEAQLLTYMKLARIRTGLLINFNQQRLIDGLRRFKL